MKSYRIIVTPDAEADLEELRDYISYTLQMPKTAVDYVHAIWTEMSQLSFMPDSIAPVPFEPWHSRGIRKIMAKNFFVYYRIDNGAGVVYILNVIYAMRDQLKVLKNKQGE